LKESLTSDIDSLPIENLQTFYHRRHRLGNATLPLAGA